MRKVIGFTHVALQASDIDASIAFYKYYAGMSVIHERLDHDSGRRVVWLSDNMRPFVLVLVQDASPAAVLGPFAHLGVGCLNRSEVDRLCEQARDDGILTREPVDSGYPVGYWAFIRDPDGHTLELSYGQEIGLLSATAKTAQTHNRTRSPRSRRSTPAP